MTTTPERLTPYGELLQYQADREKLSTERAEAVRKASELAERAKGRAFTADETGEATRLTGAVSDVDRRMNELDAKELRRRESHAADAKAQRSADADVRDQAKAFGEQLWGEGTDRAPDGSPVVDRKARDQHGWGKAVVAARTDAVGGFKAIVAAGSVPVSVPLNPDPVRENVPVNRLRSLVPSVRNTTGQWSYLRQTAREWNAAAVAVAGKKPTSRFTLERIDSMCRTIAHLSEPIARQDLVDASLLATFIDVEMRDGLEAEIERLILAGSGVGEEWAGLRNVSGTQVAAWTTNLLTTTRRALTALQAQEIDPTGWVFHPSDWERVELAATTAGNLLVTEAGERAPIDQAARRLWSVPVALSTQATLGEGWLVDFAGSTELQVREEVQLDWSENVWRPDALGTGLGASDFERNMMSWRAEGRFDFAVKRPLGVVQVELTAP